MKAFAIVNEGLEKVAAADVKELVPATNFHSNDCILTFDVGDFKHFCSLAYLSQSISRLCCSICEFQVSKSLATTTDNFKQKLKNFELTDWLQKNSFVVECERYGEHDFTSLDFKTAANKLVSEITGNNDIDFKVPHLKFYCHISDNKGYFGVDISGFDLSKREYRIFGHSSDLKATVAHSLVRLAGSNTILDPFCRSGAIAIEAALDAAHFPVNYYRKDSFSFLSLKPFSGIDFKKFFAAIDEKIDLKKKKIFTYSSSIGHVRSAEKNAKIAGINKTINFARVDLEWLELRFDKNTLDAIVSYPPGISKNSDVSKIKKVYSEFFYQADYLLSEKGKIVLAARHAEALTEAAVKNKFKLSSEMKFSMGQDNFLVLIFIKNS